MSDEDLSAQSRRRHCVDGFVRSRLFKLLRAGKHDEAMQLYWRIDPVRQMRALLSAYMQGAHFINRSLWKYWAWLHGYNGGPMPQPVDKVSAAPMRQARAATPRPGFQLED